MQTPMADLVKEHGSVSAAARAQGIHRTTMQDRLRMEKVRAEKAVHIPELPDDTEPVHDIISRKCAAFTRQKARRSAQRWLPITVPETGPFGLMVFGDEHADSNDCNWPQLIADCKLARETPGVYALAVGDATNNWVGRLIKEYADQSTTRKEARQLLKWLLSDEAAPWICRLIGNHDKWAEGDVIIGIFADSAYHVADWEARIELRTATGAAFRVHASHDFKGNSIYNKTHGPTRAAMFSGGAAELYVCGHKHNYASQSFENEEDGKIIHVVRANSYKQHDMYAVTNGFGQGHSGAAVFVLFNPDSETPAGRITIFSDPALGAKVLTALRADMSKPRAHRKTSAQKPEKFTHGRTGTRNRKVRGAAAGKRAVRGAAKGKRRRRSH